MWRTDKEYAEMEAHRERLREQYKARLIQREENERRARFGERKLHIDCSYKPEYSETLSDLLESKGYRYGYNGNPCERRAYHNMPYITVDVATGFYSGSKGADVSVEWHKACERLFMQLDQRLPDMDAIYKRARKNDGVKDNNMRQPSKDGRKMERVWITGTGRAMGISCMNDDHLHNTILMVDRTIAAGGDAIGGNRNLANLLDELEDERIHRGLHLPLIPFISLDYRKGNHND